ncbi:MAG: hypothetical protein IIC57_08155, partial [Proteobacteria bacterium]|nr:hypothetical protein [Pseudomonadota bacterium]
MASRRSRIVLKPLVFIICLGPLAYLVSAISQNTLGVEPIEALNRALGDWALRLILLTLAIRPMADITGFKQLIAYRRMIGLFAYFYVVLHVSNYLVIDLQFDWLAFGKDIIKRTIDGATNRYIEFFEGAFEGPIRHDLATEAAWRAQMLLDQQDTYYSDSLLTLDDPKTISGATQADPVVVTATAHGFSDGDTVRIARVVGMTELNGNAYTVANKTANTFELSGVDGTGFTAYSSGGEARLEVTSVTGLGHLEGETVKVLADGKVHPDATVSGG